MSSTVSTVNPLAPPRSSGSQPGPTVVERAKVLRAAAKDKDSTSGDGDPAFPPNGWDYASINSAAPPCLSKSLRGRKCLEYAACCRCVGRFGIEAASRPKPRKALLSFAAVMNCASLVIVVLMCLSLAHSASTVRFAALSRGEFTGASVEQLSILARGENTSAIVEGTTGTLYIGLSGVAFTMTNPSGEQILDVYCSWSDASMCTDAAATYCDSCRKSALATVMPAIMAAVTTIPTIQTDVQRMFRRWDLNCQKFLAVFVSAFFGCVGTMISWNSYISACSTSLPASLVGGGKAVWSLTLVFKLVILVTLLKLLDGAIHCCIKTPPPLWRTREENKAQYYRPAEDGQGRAGRAVGPPNELSTELVEQ